MWMASRRVDPVTSGLALGYLLDVVLGDPRRGHPVAVFGAAASRVEHAFHRPNRARGAVLHAALTCGVTGSALAVERITAGSPVARSFVVAAATWAALGGTSLEREARDIFQRLTAGDLERARVQISHLVGRDPAQLDQDGIARACVESLAENGSDAVVAPLLWGAALGLPGVVTYRAINTLDAMWGYRIDRYREFGWAAARVDDVANWLPARLTASLTVLMAGRPSLARAALRAWRRDAPRHPSPNAGPVEATFAGALGVVLGGAQSYHGVTEDRGSLGQGPPVRAADIPAAVRLSRRVRVASLVALLAARALLPRAARPGPTRRPQRQMSPPVVPSASRVGR